MPTRLKAKNSHKFSTFFIYGQYYLSSDINTLDLTYKLLNSSPQQKLREHVTYIFILIVSVIICIHRKHPATSFFKSNCCFPDQGKVGYQANKFTEKGLDLLIKCLSKDILRGFLLPWRHLLLNIVLNLV